MKNSIYFLFITLLIIQHIKTVTPDDISSREWNSVKKSKTKISTVITTALKAWHDGVYVTAMHIKAPNEKDSMDHFYHAHIEDDYNYLDKFSGDDAKKIYQSLKTKI